MASALSELDASESLPNIVRSSDPERAVHCAKKSRPHSGVFVTPNVALPFHALDRVPTSGPATALSKWIIE